MSVLDRIVRRIIEYHYDEYDRDLNGLSFEELTNKFDTELKNELNKEKQTIKNMHLKRNLRYKIY